MTSHWIPAGNKSQDDLARYPHPFTCRYATRISKVKQHCQAHEEKMLKRISSEEKQFKINLIEFDKQLPNASAATVNLTLPVCKRSDSIPTRKVHMILFGHWMQWAWNKRGTRELLVHCPLTNTMLLSTYICPSYAFHQKKGRGMTWDTGTTRPVVSPCKS